MCGTIAPLPNTLHGVALSRRGTTFRLPFTFNEIQKALGCVVEIEAWGVGCHAVV